MMFEGLNLEASAGDALRLVRWDSRSGLADADKTYI
jgi:hypothetical protein